MEAEHIFKKYKSIKVSLMADSEKFEKSLLELEEAITDQQVDIARMQVRFPHFSIKCSFFHFLCSISKYTMKLFR